MIIDPKTYIEKFFKVEAKTPVNGEKIIPFVLNTAQDLLLHSAKTHKWHLIPKARQLGISTAIEAYILVKCLTVPGTHAAIISHEKAATVRLLRRVKFFINQLEKDGLVVNREYDSSAEMTFPDNGSSLYIGTAGQKAFSRGDSLTIVHGSEVAFWPNAGLLMAGVLGAMTPDAEIFLESSANGMGGYFYDKVNQADEFAKGIGPESPFQLHFFPWNLAQEYRRPVVNGTLWSPEENWLARSYALTDEQLQWRRWKKSFYDSDEAFTQEFPLSLEEAFIVSGTCYFDKHALRMYQRQVKEHVAIGHVEELGDKALLNRSDDGDLKIWEFPKTMVEYLITVDVSEGIEADDTDNSCAQVINREAFAQAAVLHGKLDPIEMAERCYALGHYYKWPWIAVEDNGPGLACLLKLKEMGYPKLYRHRRLDLDSQTETEKLGWHTDMKTRPLILSATKQAVKHQIIRVFDKETLKELTTFCKQSDNGYRANAGCHDDRVLALAIAIYLHGLLPYRPDNDEERDYMYRISDRTVITHGHKTGY